MRRGIEQLARASNALMKTTAAGKAFLFSDFIGSSETNVVEFPYAALQTPAAVFVG